jgi:hypothetical protein
MGWDRSLGFLPYGDQQRKHTRLVHEGLNPIALQSQRQLQGCEAAVLLRETSNNSQVLRQSHQTVGSIGTLDLLERISERHFRYSASLILHLAYGHRVNSTDDKYVQLSETAVTATNQYGSPGSQAVDLFPARESSIFVALFLLDFVLL